LIDEIHDKDGKRIAALSATTLCEAFHVTVSERPGQVAQRTLDGSVEFTFGEYAERVRALATGLHSLGVRRGDTVALVLVNRPEFALADTAAMHLGAIAFSVYSTRAPEQINYLLQSSRCASGTVGRTTRRCSPSIPKRAGAGPPSADWQPGGDELTPTVKLKRKAIHDKYRAEIEALYRD
jgi:long-subunit acyl-CoA synthetase (AMP-forming)